MSSASATTFSEEYAGKADQLFLRPGRQYRWNEIVTGTAVRRQDGSASRMAAVAKNTFRGFHRVDKGRAGAQEQFHRYFTGQRQRLVDALLEVSDREALHQICNQVCADVRSALNNIKPDQLRSYNKIRKPVDLYVQHLAAMSLELEPRRDVLVPLLFLPLDCQILASPSIFTDAELAAHRLGRSCTYSDISTESCYQSLQQVVSQRASNISSALGRPFWPIYFDLIWNGRFRSWGSNLFETNP